MIPTRTHGILDYIIGLALIAAPWLFGFAYGGAETWTPVIVGALIIVQSLFTNYELGVVRAIPMRVHLMADVVLGLFLAVSPWLLDYDQIVWAPHLIVGLVLVGSGLLTRRVAAGACDSHHHPGRPLHH
jgi:hypothetical protein